MANAAQTPKLQLGSSRGGLWSLVFGAYRAGTQPQ